MRFNPMCDPCCGSGVACCCGCSVPGAGCLPTCTLTQTSVTSVVFFLAVRRLPTSTPTRVRAASVDFVCWPPPRDPLTSKMLQNLYVSHEAHRFCCKTCMSHMSHISRGEKKGGYFFFSGNVRHVRHTGFQPVFT